MPLTTLNASKELASAGQPLLLVTVKFVDGTFARFSTHDVSYSGNSYLQRLTEQDLQPILAASQAISSLPSVSLKLADADRQMVNQYELGKGFKGSDLTIVLVMWEVGTATFTSDSRVVFAGICDGATVSGTSLVVTARSRNLTRAFVPQVRAQSRCPWPFPSNAAERASAHSDPRSPFYRCGYSPENGRGTGSFTSCEYTQAACEARGLLVRSSGKIVSAPYGGLNWFPPKNWRSRGYLDKQFVDGVNSGPDQVYGSFFPEGYGTAWVDANVINSVGDGNSTRGEAVVCAGYIGTGILRVVVNDLEIPQSGAGVDPLFRWNYVTQGARDGAPNLDAGFDGNGDPYGSLATIEIVVYRKVTDDLRKTNVRVLTRFPQVRVYTGVSTFSDQYSENPAWCVLDMLVRTDWDYGDLDIQSFINAAAICDANVTYTDLNGVSSTHPRFGYSMEITSRTSAAEVISASLASFGGFIVYGDDGKLQLRLKGTLAEQQSSAVAGSNYNTAVASKNRAGGAVNGYFAYLFNDSNVLPPGLEFSQATIADSPNRITFEFINKDNGFAKDTLSAIDSQDIGRVGNEINGSLAVIGPNSYDQAKRIFAQLSAERLRGNPRGDTGGTLRFTLQTSIKGAHLRVGQIVGVTSAQYNLTLQPFRITQVKAGRNAETISLTLDWHNDNWYLDSYGQSADPQFSDPGKESPQRPPFAWKPGFVAPQSGDPLYGDEATFAVTQQYDSAEDGSAIAKIRVNGYLPINSLSKDVTAPFTPLQGSTSSTGGSIPGNRKIYVAFCAIDSSGRRSAPSSPTVIIDIPAGTNTNTVTVPNIRWAGGTSSYAVFAGYTPQSLTEQATAAGTPSSVTLTAINKTGVGVPDVAFDRLRVDAKPVPVPGVFTGLVEAKPSASVLRIVGAAWATNEWQNRAVSVYTVGPTGTVCELSNFTITSNTATDLTLDHAASLVNVGDVVVIRTKASTFSATTIGDSKLALTADEFTGYQVRIEFGTGAGQVARIASHSSTAITVEGSWVTTPDATSVFIVEESTWTSTAATTPTLVEASADSNLLLDVNNAQGFLIVRGVAIGPDNTEALSYPTRLVWLGGDTGTLGGGAVPGNVLAISGDAFLLTQSDYTDGAGITWLQWDIEYNPPSPIGSFVGVAVHLEVPDASGEPIFAGNFEYAGDPGGSGSARYGKVQLRLAKPTSNENWRIYLVARSNNYTNSLVLEPDAAATPNRLVAVVGGSGGIAADVPDVVKVGDTFTGSISVSPGTPDDNGLTRLAVQIQYTPPSPQGSFLGVHVWLYDGSTGRLLDGGKQPYRGTHPAAYSFYVYVEPPPTTATWTIYLASYSEAVDEALVESAGGTPRRTASIGPLTAGPAGTEWSAVVGSPSASVVYRYADDGSREYGFQASWSIPSDGRFAACRLVARTSDGTDLQLDEVPQSQTTATVGYWTIWHQSETFTLYFVSVDISGRANTIVVGTTPRVTGLLVEKQSGSAGQEHAPLVSGFSALAGYSFDSGGNQKYYFYGTFTAPSDPRWRGVRIFARPQNPTGSVSVVNGSNTITRLTGAYFGPEHKFRAINIGGTYKLIIDVTDGNTAVIDSVWSTTSGSFLHEIFLSEDIEIAECGMGVTTFTTDEWPVNHQSETFTLFAVSYDGGNRLNTIVVGTTPSVSVTVTRQVGSAGREFAAPIRSPALDAGSVVVVYSEIGEQQWFAAGTFTEPAEDPRYGGCKIVRKNPSDPNQSIEIADIPRGVGKFRGDFQPSIGTGTTLGFLSYDSAGRVNTYQAGVTPELAVSVPPQPNTLNLVKASPGSLLTAAFASSIRPVSLFAATPTLPNADYPAHSYGRNTTTGEFLRVNSLGTAWERAINGSNDILADSITAAQIAAGAISTSELFAGEILVGAGGGKPTRFRVNDSFGNMVSFIGDNGAGFVGFHAINCRIGPNINSPNFYADATQVYIQNVPLTLSQNGIVTRITNEFVGGSVSAYSGVITEDLTYRTILRPGAVHHISYSSGAILATLNASSGQMYIYSANGLLPQVQLDRSAGGTFRLYDAAGVQVLGAAAGQLNVSVRYLCNGLSGQNATINYRKSDGVTNGTLVFTGGILTSWT